MRKLSYGLVRELPVSDIVIGDNNVRRFYDEAGLDELWQSMSSDVGMLYPILITPRSDSRYELVIGSRRLAAAKKWGLEKIPAVIADSLDGQSRLVLALTENLHREDLTPFEEAWAILKLTNDYKMSAQDVAKKIGKGVQFVGRRLKLLSLPSEAQELLSRRRLNMAQMDVLARMKTPQEQLHFARLLDGQNLAPSELVAFIEREMGRKQIRHKPPGGITVEKVGLKIASFIRWLESIEPAAVQMAGGDMLKMKAALTELVAEVKGIVDRIEKAY